MCIYIYIYVYGYVYVYVYVYVYICVCVFNSKWFSNFEIISHQHPLTMHPSKPSKPNLPLSFILAILRLPNSMSLAWHHFLSVQGAACWGGHHAACHPWSCQYRLIHPDHILSQWIQFHSKIIQGWLTTMEECGRILAWYVTNCRSCDSCRNDRQALCITTEQVDLKLWKICERQKHASASKEGESSFVSLTSSTGELWVCLQKSLDFTLFCCFHPNMCW